MKCTVKIDENVQRELNDQMWVVSLISLIVGSVGLASYIVISVFVESVWLELLLWPMAFAFGVGLTLLISIKKINKKSVQNNLIDNLEIEEDYVVSTTMKNGEIISTLKTYYKDLLKVKETENFLFLYINKASAVPIPKQSFSPEEFSLIKLWVNSARIKK